MKITEIVQPRRVVTGIRSDGISYVAREELVEEIDYPYVLSRPAAPDNSGTETTKPASGGYRGGGGFFRIWGSDRLPIPLDGDGRSPFFDTEPPPEQTPDALRRAATMPPPLGVRVGWSNALKPGPPGRMHWTDSTDICFVMAGKHGQILDDDETLMYPGDVLVQNGTNHSHQTVQAPAVLGYVVLTALRIGSHPPVELLNTVSGFANGYRPRRARGENDPGAVGCAPAGSPGVCG